MLNNNMPTILHYTLIIVVGYKNYDDLGPKQKRRRKYEIGQKTREYFNEVGGNLGLVPTSIDFVSTSKNELVTIPLDNSCHTSSQESCNTHDTGGTDSELTDRILYLIMKHNIPMEFYHELTADIPALPRSYKVNYYLLTVLIYSMTP